jgi:hypothetical protein
MKNFGRYHFYFLGADAQSYLPSADAFQKGIYIIEIGGNDYIILAMYLTMWLNKKVL